VSRSPLDAAPDAEGTAGSYLAAWSALNKLLRRGYSWSGREENCAFLSLEGGGFANVSAAVGFAFPDDARALALCDWDADGDQDVFLTNRTSPRVRFLRNDQASSNASVTLELRGVHANRDAIGARVALTLVDGKGDRRRLVRAVRAGEGYLAQSSTRLTVGLGTPRAELVRVVVTWPGGADEEFSGVGPARAWRLVEGSGRAEPLELPPAQPLPAARPVAPEVTGAARVPLVRAVPLPRLELVAEDGSPLALFGLRPGGEGTGPGRVLSLQLFSTTCAPCAAELGELARRAAELERAGIAPLALSVEPPEERSRAGAFLRERQWPFPWAVATGEALEILDALAAILLDREQRLALPASFLVDAQGALRVLYLGPVTAERLLADRALCELGEGGLFEAASPFAGRWMFQGLPADADFFEGRLLARGLEAPAREFSRARLTVVRTAPAELLQEFGRKSAVEGRLEEAENYFRRALAADPRHFGALFDWAVVLHRQERLEQAAELYGKALALEPEHADARFNLALARLALGDRASAERELRWLKERGEESAAVLERVLAER
jgi:tetratricopeptide (TPR) repeat protein